MMRRHILALLFWCAVALLTGNGVRAEDLPAAGTTVPASVEPVAVTAQTPNSVCLGCHGVGGFAVPKGQDGLGPKRHLSLDVKGFSDSVHGQQSCVSCHADIREMPHKKGESRAVDCVTCHRDSAKTLKSQAGHAPEKAALARVETQITAYLASPHAQPRKDDPAHANASCGNCHTAHYIFPSSSPGGKAFRQSSPEFCGSCHAKQAADYKDSVHAVAVRRFGDNAATCADCHKPHPAENPKANAGRVNITQACGSCHSKELESYRASYHGQVSALGYGHTAQCSDCHEAHATHKPDAAGSRLIGEERLKVCRTCHKQATEGFKEFQPHGDPHDFKKYPAVWIASKFMIALLFGVFAFFWTHCALWFWREWQDRKKGVHHVLVDGSGNAVHLPPPPAGCENKHIMRFSPLWRIAHLALAVAVMVLVLTGTTLLYAESSWAPVVMKLIGGPKVEGILHRSAACVFAVVFFGHLAYAAIEIFIRKRRTFRWFGPRSLLPNWQDFRDFASMMRWFLGKGPRPTFDHWTYWEKFDYWAPFWGMFIIGVSGLTLWFPDLTARYLPGWVFNVATIVHGEEAFLAGVFLFTVHYFNCHFRPSKLPQDLVMFTGTVPLAEFREERAVEYLKLVESGELEKVLVDPPTAEKTRRAAWLGGVLIIVGLLLLLLIAVGFVQGLLH